MRYLAIDIGASSGRHILGEMKEGRLHMREIYRFSNAPKRERGVLLWDTEALFSEILIGLKRAKTLGEAPDVVGIDTWAVDYVLLDRTGRLTAPVTCYRDPSCAVAARAAEKCAPFSWLYERTGIQFQPFNTLYRLYADAQAGRLERAEKLLMLPDYFHYLLTGRVSREYTNATSTGLIDVRSGTWDEEILHALGLPSRLFPPLSPPMTALGGFLPRIQEEVGYNAEVVLPATHDTASAVIGSKAGEGQPYLSSGTWSLFGAMQRKPHTDAMSRAANYTNEGHIGGLLRFQKNITGLWMVNKIREEECPQLSFSSLMEEAKRTPVSARIDVNDARFTAPRRMLEEVQGAAGGMLSPYEAVYCVLASLAEKYREALEELSNLTGERYSSLNVIGGGSRNELLGAMTAKATGVKLIAGPAEATAAGNLAVQMAASGLTPSIEEARNIIKLSHEEGYIS